MWQIVTGDVIINLSFSQGFFKMMINSPKFLKSALKPEDFPQDSMPEVAVVGRSNAGKSSLLNCLLNAQGLCRTSKTPGCTRTINFFAANDKFRFVDLPGYGYASVDKSQKQEWPWLVNDFLESRENIRLVLFLMDCRRIPNDVDLDLIRWFVKSFEKAILVLTKSDKLSRSQILQHTQKLEKLFSRENIHIPMIEFSVKTAEGKRKIAKILDDFVRLSTRNTLKKSFDQSAKH